MSRKNDGFVRVVFNNSKGQPRYKFVPEHDHAALLEAYERGSIADADEAFVTFDEQLQAVRTVTAEDVQRDRLARGDRMRVDGDGRSYRVPFRESDDFYIRFLEAYGFELTTRDFPVEGAADGVRGRPMLARGDENLLLLPRRNGAQWAIGSEDRFFDGPIARGYPLHERELGRLGDLAAFLRREGVARSEDIEAELRRWDAWARREGPFAHMGCPPPGRLQPLVERTNEEPRAPVVEDRAVAAFLRGQGYESLGALGDGGSLFGSAEDRRSNEYEYVAITFSDDGRAWVKSISPAEVENYRSVGETLTFSGIAAERKPLERMFEHYGLESQHQLEAELGAWRQWLTLPPGLPPPLSIKDRYQRSLAGPGEELGLAAAFAGRLKLQGFTFAEAVQDVCLYRRERPGQSVELLGWRLSGQDGEPRYLQLSTPEAIQSYADAVASVRGGDLSPLARFPEGDFGTFLHAEGVSLEELPPALVQLPLPVHVASHPRELPERLSFLDLGRVESRGEQSMVHDWPVRDFLVAQGFAQAGVGEDGSRLFIREVTAAKLAPPFENVWPGEYLVVTAHDTAMAQFKKLALADVAQHLGPEFGSEKEATPWTFDTFERPAGDLDGMLVAQGLHRPFDVAGEAFAWETWQRLRDTDHLPRLPGIRSDLHEGEVLDVDPVRASDQLSLALGFVQELQDRGFGFEGTLTGGTYNDFPVFRRAGEVDAVVWRFGEGEKFGRPVWKNVSPEELAAGTPYHLLPGTEFGADRLAARDQERVLAHDRSIGLDTGTSTRETPVEELRALWGEEDRSRDGRGGVPAVAPFWRSQGAFETFLRVQGYENSTTLPDGARVFRRAADTAQLAIEFNDGGQLAWKQVSPGELAQAGTPAFHQLDGQQRSFEELLSFEGLQTAAGVAQELEAWASWQETNAPAGGGANIGMRPPPRSIRESIELSSFSLDDEGWQDLPNGAAVPFAADSPLAGDLDVSQEDAASAIYDGASRAASADDVIRDEPNQSREPSQADEGDTAAAIAFGALGALGGLADGQANGAEQLAAAQLQVAEKAPFVPGAPVSRTGYLIYGPEGAVTSRGVVSRVVIWPDGRGPGDVRKPEAVYFFGPLAKATEGLRPGDVIDISGLRSERFGMAATSLHIGGSASAHELPADFTFPTAYELRERFAVPNLWRVAPVLPGLPAFQAALEQGVVRVQQSADLTDPQLAQLIDGLADLGVARPGREQLRDSFDYVDTYMPEAIAKGLEATALRLGRGGAFSFEWPAAALDQRFEALTVPGEGGALAGLGIRAATLDAAPFRGAFREDGEAIALRTVGDDGLTAGIQYLTAQPREFAEALPDRATGQPGVWSSRTPDGPCRKVVISNNPASLLAYYQEHPSNDALYIATCSRSGRVEEDGAVDRLRAMLLPLAESNDAQRTAGLRPVPPSMVVLAEHGSRGLALHDQMRAVMPEFELSAMFPPLSGGRQRARSWLEHSQRTAFPERHVDLPAYVQSRLGAELVFSSDDHKDVILKMPAAEQSTDRSARAPGGALVRGAQTELRKEHILLKCGADGQWQYSTHAPGDRGDVLAFAASRLALSADEARQDLRHFTMERSLIDRTEPLTKAGQELAAMGIRPETMDDPSFRGSLRTMTGTEGERALVFSLQNGRGFCGVWTESMVKSEEQPSIGGVAGVWASNPMASSQLISRIVIVSHPREALAYHQQNPPAAVELNQGRLRGAQQDREHVQYVACPDLKSRIQVEALQSILSHASSRRGGESPQLVVAAAGDRLLARVQEVLPYERITHHPPTLGSSWAETVQRRERELSRAISRGRSDVGLELGF